MQSKSCASYTTAMDVTGNATQMLPCRKERNFPEDLGCWVFINYIDEDGLWVMLESEEPIMQNISDALNINVIPERVQNPSVNDVVSALNTDNTWYRAIIEAVEPEIKIRFIDFGDTLVVPKENLAPLPPSLFSLHPLAMKVQLPPDSTLQPVLGLKMFVQSACSRMGSVVVDVIHVGDEALTHHSGSKEIPDGCSSSLESSNDALICSRFECSEISSDHTSADMLTFESISLLDVPPPSGFSSDIFSDQKPVENDSEILQLKENDAPLPDQEPDENDSQQSKPQLEENDPEIMQLKEHDAPFPDQEPDENDSQQSKPQLEENVASNQEPAHQALDSNDATGPKTQHEENDTLLSVQESEEINVIQAQEVSSDMGIEIQDKLSQNVVETLSSQGSTVLGPDTEIVGSTDVSSAHPVESSLKDINECVSSSSLDQLLDVDEPHSVSILEQCPSIGGGYAAHSAAADLDTNENLPTPRMITKGCSTESSLVCEQETQHPQSSSSPSEQNEEISKLSPQKSISMDEFKAILDFELSIIREQNRLQILQLQRKMEQNLATIKDEVARQLVNFQSDVKSRIGIVNASVVRKVADIYSDITMLKNDREMNVHSQSKLSHTSVTGKPRQPSRGMQEFPPAPSSQDKDPRQSLHHAMNEFRINTNSHRDADKQNGNYRSSYEGQSQGQFSSEFSKKTCNLMNDMKGPPNSLMEGFKEKMKDGRNGRDFHHNHQYNEPSSMERSPNHNYYRDSSMHRSLNEHLDKQHSFSVGQFNPNCFKMDHFNPSESGLEASTDPDTKKTGSIISVSNINIEKTNVDLLFNLIGVYGNVQRIKISHDGKKAFIEMENSAQAEEVIKHLNRAPLMGQKLYVSSCSFPKLNFITQDLEANFYKDYTRHQVAQSCPNRFKTFKWDPTKLFSPSPKLMITNVLQTVSDDKLKELFAKNGFTIQHISNRLLSSDKKAVYVTFGSTEEAVNALTVMHLQETSDWIRMRITFGRPEKLSR